MRFVGSMMLFRRRLSSGVAVGCRCSDEASLSGWTVVGSPGL